MEQEQCPTTLVFVFQPFYGTRFLKLVSVTLQVMLLLMGFALIVLKYLTVVVLMQTILPANAFLHFNGLGTQQLKQVLVCVIQPFR